MINRFREALGSSNVIVDGPTLSAHEKATFVTHQRVPMVLTPGNVQDLMKCLAIANEFRLPLYPISRGKNWGYGSKVPVNDGCAIVSLHRLNDISGFNERLGYVTVEPGVTFNQLQEFLIGEGANLFINAPGSTPEASIIGNVMERGICMGPVNSRMDQIISMEVLMANGQLIKTGMPGDSAHRWRLGPSLEGLFTQSNLGIVTNLTIALNHIPAYHQQCYATIKHLDESCIQLFQECKAKKMVDTGISIFNDYKILSAEGQFPFDKTSTTPLPDDLKDAITVDYNHAEWFVQMSISAESMTSLNAKREVLEQLLLPCVGSMEFSEINEENPMYSNRDNFSAQSMYWRKKQPLPEELSPEQDRCGVLWHGVVVPFESDRIRKVIDTAKSVILKHSFEPSISLQCNDHLVVHIVMSIIYDMETPEHNDMAVRCHDQLYREMEMLGCYPYRLGINSMDKPGSMFEDTAQMIKQLKQLFDPNDILAPGRYDFRHLW